MTEEAPEYLKNSVRAATVLDQTQHLFLLTIETGGGEPPCIT